MYIVSISDSSFLVSTLFKYLTVHVKYPVHVILMLLFSKILIIVTLGLNAIPTLQSSFMYYNYDSSENEIPYK